MARQRSERGTEAWRLRFHGDIASRHRRVDGAARHYGDALALVTERGMQPLMGRCHAGLGRLDRRSSDAQADEDIERAATLYRAVDMPSGLAELDVLTSR